MASLKKRGDSYYLQFYLPGKKQQRINLHTDSLQIAKEKLRKFESAKARGNDSPLPTRTSIPQVLEAYVQYIRNAKTAKSAQTDIYYLRSLFGPVTDALKVTSRELSAKVKKRPPKPGQDQRRKARVIEAGCFEQITTAQLAAFISGQMASRGLAPKTANRFRDTASALFSWAMTQHGVRMPEDKNPAAGVKKLKETAPEISFLTFDQVKDQLAKLGDSHQLQAMVATFIYAGLRREELLWLRHEDIDWDAKPHGLIRVRAKTAGGESWQPKTKTNRAVPVSSDLRPYLDKQRMRAAKSEWLFPNTEGGRYDPDNFSSDLRTAQEKAKLEWTCLDFRHTFGSLLAQRGVSLYHISAMMGNSPEICRRHYAALVPAALAPCVEFNAPPQTTTPNQPAVVSA